MSAFDIITVPIVRTGKTKQTDLSYAEAEAPIPGSPTDGWPCRYYHKKSRPTGRTEAEQGVAMIDDIQTLSVQVPGADVRENDIAILPAGTIKAAVPVRALLIRPRFYPWGVQCDIETGATPAAPA